MKTILIIFILSVQSSYLSDKETAATEKTFDTIQFYSTNGTNWRIKTFSTDQDVHIWSLGTNEIDIIEIAKANTEKHYGDVLKECYIIESDNGIDGIKEELKKRGLPVHLEAPSSGAVFWVPANTKYRSKSKPKQKKSNQQVEPIVTTPVDKVEAQSTQAHP